MKAVIAAAALFAAVVAQTNPLASLPACGQTCYAKAFGSSAGSCGQTDVACLCANQAFVSAVTTCVTSSCSGNDLVTVAQFGQQQCAAVSASPSLPASASSSLASKVESASSVAVKSSGSASAGASSKPVVMSSMASMASQTTSAAAAASTPNSGADRLVAGAGVAAAAAFAMLAL